MPEPSKFMTGSTPILAVSDVPATIRHYKDVLGFTSSWEWGEPPTFGCASTGKVNVMFCLQPDIARHIEGHQHWFDVEDVDALYEQHQARGAQIQLPIRDQPWGKREYVVRDLNGYHLRFAGDRSYVSRGIVGPAEGITFHRRKPTLDEYRRLVGQNFYTAESPDWYLDAAWCGVVAQAPSGEIIGTARIVHDAPGWFSVWDVAVAPEWQNRRIGTAMMQQVLATVRAHSPGAWVYLFTTADPFYERIGFAKNPVQMCRA